MMNVFNYILVAGVLAVALSLKFEETSIKFRVEAGTETCFFENGKSGQFMELYYEVGDGQHGDLDISVDVFGPNGKHIISDYKKSQNNIILELEHEGDYMICLDNTFSMMNSKLVFIDLALEDRTNSTETEVTTADGEKLEEIMEWMGKDEEGNTYNMDVQVIVTSLNSCLQLVVKARRMLEVYGAMKSRDTYVAMEGAFIVDLWSGSQVILMISVGLLQVYMIKKLFQTPNLNQKTFMHT